MGEEEATAESVPMLPSLRAAVAVAAGGAIGGTARTCLSLAFPVELGAFPWTTFLENIGGAFLLGALLAVFDSRAGGDVALRSFLATGVLGSFTTFSTYTIESVQLVLAGGIVLPAVYASGSIAAGIVAAYGGLQVGRALASDT